MKILSKRHPGNRVKNVTLPVLPKSAWDMKPIFASDFEVWAEVYPIDARSATMTATFSDIIARMQLIESQNRVTRLAEEMTKDLKVPPYKFTI